MILTFKQNIFFRSGIMSLLVGLFGLDVDQGEVVFRRVRVQLLVEAFHLTAGAVDDDDHVADDGAAENQALFGQLQTVP